MHLANQQGVCKKALQINAFVFLSDIWVRAWVWAPVRVWIRVQIWVWVVLLLVSGFEFKCDKNTLI